MNSRWIEISQEPGDAVESNGYRVTPVNWSLTLSWLRGGWVWNRPAAVFVEKDGEIRLSSQTLREANFDDESGSYTLEIDDIGDGPTPTTAVRITCASTASISNDDPDDDDSEFED